MPTEPAAGMTAADEAPAPELVVTETSQAPVDAVAKPMDAIITEPPSEVVEVVASVEPVTEPMEQTYQADDTLAAVVESPVDVVEEVAVVAPVEDIAVTATAPESSAAVPPAAESVDAVLVAESPSSVLEDVAVSSAPVEKVAAVAQMMEPTKECVCASSTAESTASAVAETISTVVAEASETVAAVAAIATSCLV